MHMPKKESSKLKVRKFKSLLADKILMLSLILFIFSLFILDVNANNIGAYGLDTQVNLIRGERIPATTMFWTGFIGACFFFFLTTIRSLYHKKKYPSKLDLFFGLIGVIGLMIILSGGLLIFWHNNALVIPLFSSSVTRIGFYHTGIALSVISIIYFALTK